MNRKEAADILRKLNYIQCTGEPTIDEQMAAVKMAIGCLEYGWNDAALLGPQPDPDTGCPECSWIDPALSDCNYCKNCGRRLRDALIERTEVER